MKGGGTKQTKKKQETCHFKELFFSLTRRAANYE